MPWLKCYNPTINWQSGQLVFKFKGKEIVLGNKVCGRSNSNNSNSDSSSVCQVKTVGSQPSVELVSAKTMNQELRKSEDISSCILVRWKCYNPVSMKVNALSHQGMDMVKENQGESNEVRIMK